MHRICRGCLLVLTISCRLWSPRASRFCKVFASLDTSRHQCQVACCTQVLLMPCTDIELQPHTLHPPAVHPRGWRPLPDLAGSG